jgi:hypothetical protein
MPISDAELFAHFSGDILWIQSEANIGLKAIVTIALLAWRANGQGASGQQIRNVFLGSDPEKLLETRFWRGIRLYKYWQKHGLPEEIRRSTNSLDDARNASLNWLATKKGVSRQEDIHLIEFGLYDRPQFGPSAEDQKIRQISAAIANACSDKWEGEGVFCPSDFAVAIIRRLPVEQAEEFCLAATETLADLTRKKDAKN